jgi:hypothetical protein
VPPRLAGLPHLPDGAVVTVARARLPEPVVVALDDLKPHPKNYREHPADQLDHIERSLRENGQYRNIVTAKDGTILAGHGVWEAMRDRLGWKEARAIRLPITANSPAALKVLAGDNEIGRRAVIDDRALADILKEIQEVDVDGLLGTGYDAMMLANLAYVTRNGNEIADFDAAAAWAGMPDYDPGDLRPRLIITFDSEAEREAFAKQSGISLRKSADGRQTWSARWPEQAEEDLSSLRYVQAE